MEDAKQLWPWWQRFFGIFVGVFTAPGWRQFLNWITGLVLCDEQHTITQTVISLGLEEQWRDWERIAEYGAWDERQMESQLMRLLEQEAPARFAGLRPCR